MKLLTSTLVFFCLYFSSTALGESLKCNSAQTRCVVATTDLGVGDRVGVFTEDRELVATGVVSKLRGTRRTVTIKKTYGTIKQGHRLALLKNEKGETMKNLKTYKPKSELTVGGGLGLTSVQVGESSPATEFTGAVMWRKWYDIQLVGRLSYMVMEGEVSRTTVESGLENAPISMAAYGLLGGAGYTWRDNKPVGFRSELSFGFLNVDATVDGDPGLVSDPGYDTRMKNGLGTYLRGQSGVLWNLDSWHVEAALSYGLIHNAHAPAFQAALLKDIE